MWLDFPASIQMKASEQMRRNLNHENEEQQISSHNGSVAYQREPCFRAKHERRYG
jgi:hypothetical protein